MVLALNTFSRTNYTFAGWSTTSSGTGTVYRSGQSVNFSASTGQIIVLYAQWQLKTGVELMTLSNTDTTIYTTTYTYDANNRLTTESTTQGGTATTISYTYDDNGNLLSQLDMNSTAIVTHSYNGFNQLISSVTGDGTITYAYNAQGIRTSRTVELPQRITSSTAATWWAK